MVDKLLSKLINEGVHFGHKTCRLNPKMISYISGEIKGIHIIDLTKTVTLLKRAKSYLESSAREGKTFLFVGTKDQVSSLIAEEAIRCNSFYVNHHWLGGTLTNWNTFRKRIRYLKDLEKRDSSLLTKKEEAFHKMQLEKFRIVLGGIKEMRSLPDIVIIIDQNQEMNAVLECRKLGIPIVSFLDTNCNPDLIDIPIPGNDDGVRSIRLILKSLTNSIINGKSKTTKFSNKSK